MSFSLDKLKKLNVNKTGVNMKRELDRDKVEKGWMSVNINSTTHNYHLSRLKQQSNAQVQVLRCVISFIRIDSLLFVIRNYGLHRSLKIKQSKRMERQPQKAITINREKVSPLTT